MKCGYLFELLKRLGEDERGDIPVGQLLIIGLIVIPLVIVLVTFRDQLLKFLSDQWNKISGKEDAVNPFGGK